MNTTPFITLRPLTPADRPAYEAIYEASFPAVERKPMESMLTGEHAHAFDVLVVETDEQPVAGMVINVTHGNLTMLDFLAIHPAMRGRGLGHAVLPLVRDTVKQPSPDKHFFLEIEVPTEGCDNREQRIRRKAFYLSAGLVETHIHAYNYETEMELLAYPEDAPHITFEGYADLTRAYFPQGMWAERI